MNNYNPLINSRDFIGCFGLRGNKRASGSTLRPRRYLPYDFSVATDSFVKDRKIQRTRRRAKFTKYINAFLKKLNYRFLRGQLSAMEKNTTKCLKYAIPANFQDGKRGEICSGP